MKPRMPAAGLRRLPPWWRHSRIAARDADPAPALRRAALGSLAAVLLSAGLLLATVAGAADRQVLLAINAAAASWPLLASNLSVTGLGVSVVLLAAASGPDDARLLGRVVLAVIVGGLLVQAVKTAVGAPRPPAVLGSDLLHVVGTHLATRSMPSGHASAAAALAALTWLGRPRGATWPGMAALLALGVGWARLAVGVHWPSDVLVGAAIGLTVALRVSAPGSRLAALADALASAMRRRAGSRVTAAGIVVLAALLHLAPREVPLGESAHLTLAALGLWAALSWWRQHPGTVPRRARLSWRRTGRVRP